MPQVTSMYACRAGRNASRRASWRSWMRRRAIEQRNHQPARSALLCAPSTVTSAPHPNLACPLPSDPTAGSDCGELDSQLHGGHRHAQLTG